MGLNKYFQKVMITFKQFLEEAKKKEVKTKLSKKQVMKILDKQGGIGAKAVQKYIEKNPNYGPREYTLGDKM
jgi:hypothetical protein